MNQYFVRYIASRGGSQDHEHYRVITACADGIRDKLEEYLHSCDQHLVDILIINKL